MTLCYFRIRELVHRSSEQLGFPGDHQWGGRVSPSRVFLPHLGPAVWQGPVSLGLGCDWDLLTLQLAQAHGTGLLRTSGSASSSPGPARVHRGFHDGFLPLCSRAFSAWPQRAPKALPCSGPCSFHLAHESYSKLLFQHPTPHLPLFYQN